MAESKDGWAWPLGYCFARKRRKKHYLRNGKALCGSVADFTEERTPDTGTWTQDCCRRCTDILDKPRPIVAKNATVQRSET